MIHIKILSFAPEAAECGMQIADRLRDVLVERYQMGGDPSLTASSLSRLVQQAMVDCDLIVLIADVDTVVRAVAPYIANSGYDPGVLCLDVPVNGVVQLLNSQKDEVKAAAVQIAELFRVPLIL